MRMEINEELGIVGGNEVEPHSIPEQVQNSCFKFNYNATGIL